MSLSPTPEEMASLECDEGGGILEEDAGDEQEEPSAGKKKRQREEPQEMSSSFAFDEDQAGLATEGPTSLGWNFKGRLRAKLPLAF